MSSLRHKLWLGFGGLLLVLVAVSVLTVVVFTRYSHAMERVFHENYDSAIYCDGMEDALDRLNLRAQFLIWNHPPADGIDVRAEEGKFEDNLARQFNNVSLRGEGTRTQRLADLWKQYKTRYEQFDSVPATQRMEVYGSDLLPRYQEIKTAARQISDMNMSNMVSVDGHAKQTLVSVRDSLVVLVIAGTILAAGLIWAVGAAILYPLKALTRSARQIEEGNLDPHVPVRSGDEIGQLAEAFNSMSGKLREFRRLDHDRLLRTQQTTQLAIDSLPDAVFIVGPGGTVEISNRTARTHFGIEPGLTVESLGARLKWLLPLYESARAGTKPDDPQGYRSAVQLFDQGQERYLLPRAVPMIDAEQTPIGVAFILVDVTRLRAADEVKSGLVSTVSHELRTPLTGMRMALSLLSGGQFGRMSEKQTTLLQTACQDSERLQRIIENLLSISRIESGRVEFQFQPMRPRDILAQALDPMRSAFEGGKIRLEVQSPDDLPQVSADPVAVGSVLSNLLSNALKFTPPGGTVRVSAEAEADCVSFFVSDTGPGIPDAFATRIFDKFFRIPREQGPGGAGLGLAIAKEVVEAHGGMIHLYRNGQPGSTFRFTLRRSAPAAGIGTGR